MLANTRLVIAIAGIALLGLFIAAVPAFMPWLLWQAELDAELLTEPRDLANGEYILQVSGCAACHTQHKPGAKALAGGKRLRTPYGTLLAPNITPDPVHGIGGWSDEEFVNAIKYGLSPEGKHYFAAFPYTSYIKMTDKDVLDMKAYIDQKVAPVVNNIEKRSLTFPFNQRFLVGFWKTLYLRDSTIAKVDLSNPVLARGAYVTEALGHCGECHTRRDIMSGIRPRLWMQGVPVGEFGPSPNITASAKALAHWSVDDWHLALTSGQLPSGEAIGGEMALVIDEITAHLSDTDKEAMVRYFMALRGGHE